MDTKKIHLRDTPLAITERCSLKCKLCIAYIPYHENPRDMTLDEVNTILKRYFKLITDVDSFCITGGEPLLHPELFKIFEMIIQYKSKINKSIDITTNGTLMFSESVLDFLKKHNKLVRVIISDYGDFSPKAKQLEDVLRSIQVNYRTEHYNGESPLYGGWIDTSDHSLKHITEEARNASAMGCHYKNKRGFPIRKGELHNCARSYWRMHKEIIPRNKDEYIDLLDVSQSVDEQRAVLIRMIERVSCTSCAYCWGSSDKNERYLPAEQI